MLRNLAAAVRAAAACTLLAACPLSAVALSAEVPGYRIVSVDGDAGARKLSVRIDNRLSEPAAKELAKALSEKPKTGERIATVNFYLPGGELSEGPWGVARIEAAGVQLNVLGLRAEEEAAFRAEAEADTRDVAGVWLTSPPALPGKLTIVRGAKGRFFAEWHLRSGQKTTDELTMSRASRGTRYDVAGGDGAYYLAAWNGSLQLGDATRIIATAEKLIVEKKPAPVASNKKEPAAVKAQVPAQAALGKGNAPSKETGPVQQSASAAESPAGALPEPVRAIQKSRHAKTQGREKSRSSVADLISGSYAR